jgi:sec-independent protein translocase protein TatA
VDIGAPELLIVLFIVLLIFGPGRVVKLSREIAASIRQFREGLAESSESDEPNEKDEAPDTLTS